MGKITGFKEFKRKDETYVEVKKRVTNYDEFTIPLSKNDLQKQGSRCMDCGIPFCHSGCPLGNLIPDFNHMVHQGEWKKASWILHSTNNFPEFTGRLCPAPCEKACVLGIIEEPISIENIEKYIVEKAFKEGWIKPHIPKTRTGKTVAVIGSGPAGLAAAQQLNRAGHKVKVFERDSVIGGLLSLGIPEFKLEKWVVKRRIDLLEKEGIEFFTNVNVGVDYKVEDLDKDFDAVCLAGGSTIPRNLEVEGRDLNGIHYAMEYLTQQNKNHKGLSKEEIIDARGKHVVILGGGDTGADCLGTATRQGAASVTQLELMSAPPEERGKYNPWPEWPLIMRTSSAHEENGNRDYSVLTKKLSGKDGNVELLHGLKIDFVKNDAGGMDIKEIPNSEFTKKADLVLLAMGFLHPQKKGLIEILNVDLDGRGNVKTDSNMMTTKKNYFSCGDMNHGQSLVVRAIASGRECARNIDLILEGNSKLPKVRGYARI